MYTTFSTQFNPHHNSVILVAEVHIDCNARTDIKDLTDKLYSLMPSGAILINDDCMETSDVIFTLVFNKNASFNDVQNCLNAIQTHELFAEVLVN
jgi:hypothetical protein